MTLLPETWSSHSSCCDERTVLHLVDRKAKKHNFSYSSDEYKNYLGTAEIVKRAGSRAQRRPLRPD
jgi:hypothetical protein